MTIGRALGLGSAIIVVSGCQSWQYRDVGTLPPTAAIPETSEPGKVRISYFNNVSGSKVESLTSLDRYPDAPDEVAEITSLEVLESRGDNYGALVRGFILPPVSGEYQFFVSGDDETHFLFSDSALPADAQRIASVPDWSRRNEYDKYSSQTSPIRTLQAHQRYYFEIRLKEASGGDHFSVAWQGPGISRQVITSDHIATWAQPRAPEDMDANQAYSLGYRVGYVDGSQGLSFNPSFPPLDNDGDGLYDNWEVLSGLDPNNADDAMSDQDNDLLPAADEFLIGASPNQADSDNDGIPDGYEYAYGLEPMNAADASLDLDGDGFSNLEEFNADTDIDDAEDVPQPTDVEGLVGQYFEGVNFNQFVTARHDGNVAFRWSGSTVPAPGLPIDNFSVRWSGRFTAPHPSGSEKYRFTAVTDDGVRLYVDGDLVINDWRDHGPTAFSHTQSLAAGQSVPVVMEFYERAGGATAELAVTNASTGQTLPTTSVFQSPDPSAVGANDSDSDGIPDSWELRYGLNPWSDDASKISNPSGVTNLQAYRNQLNPWTLAPAMESAPGSPANSIVLDGDARLNWSAPLTREDGASLSLSEIDHYQINYGQSSERLDLSITVPGDTTAHTFDDLAPGNWYFTIQVVDTEGLKSPPSEVVSKTVD